MGNKNNYKKYIYVFFGAFVWIGFMGSEYAFAQRSAAKQVYKRFYTETSLPYHGKVSRKAVSAAAKGPRESKEAPYFKSSAVEHLRRELAELQNVQEKLLKQKMFLEGQQRTRLAVFQALPYAAGPVNTYSGTVFKVKEKGKEEIFGVIAAHTLAAYDKMPGALGKTFRVAVVRQGRVHVLTAKVVQITSRKMWDLALVKFDKKDEAMFVPLTLTNNPLADKELYSHGFACDMPATVPSRIIKEGTAWKIKTSIPVEKQARAGLCGSAVLNHRHELVGIHIGSTAQANAADDIGFVTPVAVLRALVKAYYNDGKAAIPLLLNAKKAGYINVDEFVTAVSVLDENKRVLWSKQTNGKYSARPVETWLKANPQARYVKFDIGQAQWNYAHKQPVMTEDLPAIRSILYDVKTK